MGRELRAGRFPFKDDIYYRYPGCIPFLSTFYPPNLLTAWLGCTLPIDTAFRLFTWLILSHSLLGSIVAWFAFCRIAGPLSAAFGALTLTYAAYNIKPQTPASAFTICWFPGVLLGGIPGGICLGMSLLGGYYPPIIYVLPVMMVLCPGAVVTGLLLGLPQIIPFLWYYRRSIRMGQTLDRNWGRIPFRKFIDLILPHESTAPTNGVHYPEVAMYMGVIPFFFVWHWSWWWIAIVFSLLVCFGFLKPIQRIPARSLYLLTFSVAALLPQVPIEVLFLQALLLLSNASIYPSFPFSQWYNRPSRLYARYSDPDAWPLFSGYLTGRKTRGYVGGFSLKDGQWQTQM